MNIMQTNTMQSGLASYEIDLTKAAPTPSKTVATSQSDFVAFVRDLARKVNSSTSTRTYSFNNDSRVKKTIENILKTGFLKNDTAKIAKYLYDAEVTYSSKYKVADIKQGSLLISRFNIGKDDLLLIAKIDFESFFNRDSLKKQEGLPSEKGLLKAALFNLKNGLLPNSFKIADSNNSISKFWSSEFLSALPFKSDSENTKNAYSTIIKAINRVLKDSTEDRITLTNSIKSYFSTKSKFDASSFTNDVIGSYTCVGDTPVKEVKSQLDTIIKSGKFDGIFNIISSEIKSKMKETYKLEDDISIVTNQGTKGRIYSKDIDGKKYVLIQSDTGYNKFPNLI